MELISIKYLARSDAGFMRASFETSKGELTLMGTPDNLDSILSQLSAAIRDARKAAPGPGIVPAALPASCGAQPTKDGKAVLLRFVMQNGLCHQFALPARNARAFQSRIDDACKRCGA